LSSLIKVFEISWERFETDTDESLISSTFTRILHYHGIAF